MSNETNNENIVDEAQAAPEVTVNTEIENEDGVFDQATLDSSLAIVTKYMMWSMGAGLIPLPGIDIAAVSGVQLKMISELSKKYGVKFSQNAGKSIIGALIGGLSADALSKSYLTSFLKTIPIIGVVASVSMPIFSGATTWAIGKVFIQHFASGGTFLDFDPKAVNEYFKRVYQQGQQIAKKMKSATA